ncbi:MAG: hypothetical protein ACKV0T_07910, partial [Planctomycetales bacterium]
MRQSASVFESPFQALKRRILAVSAGAGVGWGWCGALLLVLAGVWLDLVWDLSPAARIVLLGLAFAAGSVLLGLFVFRAAARTRDVLLARRLDEAGQTAGEITSGYTLQAGGTSAAAPLTQGLAQLAVNRAVQLAAQIRPATAVPSRGARRAGLVALSMVLGLLLGAVFAPQLAGTEWRRFADPFGDHPPYSRTQFLVEPAGAQVRFGDPWEVQVTTQGPPVEDLELVIRRPADAAGRAAAEESLPMFADAQEHWRAQVSSVTDAGEYFVRARGARSVRYPLEVLTVPEIEEVRFRVLPPEYTGDRPYEGKLPPAGIPALAGTTIEVVVRSNRPLLSGEVSLGGAGGLVALLPSTDDGACQEVVGRWQVEQGGAFQIRVTDVAGQVCREPFAGSVTLLKDQTPIVRLAEPAAQSLATPSIVLPVAIVAEDDYGISRLELYRSLNDSRPLPMSLAIESPPARRQEISVPLPLSTYGLRPGDIIKLFARVEDNDPAGAKGSESTVVVIQIVSDDELERLVRTREGVDALVSKYQEAQRRLAGLQDELEKLRKQLEQRDSEGALSPGEREQLETLAKQIEEEAQALRDSAKHPLPYDLDQELNEELERLAKHLDQAAQEAREASQEPNATAGQTAQRLAEMQEELAKERGALKEGINDPMDQLAEIYPLLEDQYRFVELSHRQRDLAERLASLKSLDQPDSPSVKNRMRELEAQQQRLRQDLDQLLGDIESHAASLPDDDPQLAELAESSRQFVQDVRESQADQEMLSAATGLGEFSGSRGHA